MIASVNNRPVKIDHIVEGGPLSPGDPVGEQGVVVGHQTRLGRVSLSKPAEMQDVTGPARRFRGLRQERAWRDEDDKVQCIVLLRCGDQTIPAVNAVKEKVAELNDPEHGRMLPGVQIEPYYDRNDLVHVTTETVEENLILGMVLVTAVLLMFLSNVRTAHHRGHQHSPGAPFCLHVALLSGQVGQPPVDRRGGFRHHRR